MTHTVDHIYTTLGLEPALEFEAQRLSLDQRSIGTTTRMLVSILADLVMDVPVSLTMFSQAECTQAHHWLRTKARILVGEISPLENLMVRSYSESTVPTTNAKCKYYWDHNRDPLTGLDLRVIGPFGWARYASLERTNINSDVLCYHIFDRDQERIGCVTQAGLEALKNRHYTAIEVD